MIHLISRLRIFQQSAIIHVTPDFLRAVNVYSLEEASIPRSSTHPRTLVSSSRLLARDLKSLLSQIFKRKWVQCRLIFYLDGLDNRGYTPIEREAIKEAAENAGAMQVFIAFNPISIPVALDLLTNKHEFIPCDPESDPK